MSEASNNPARITAPDPEAASLLFRRDRPAQLRFARGVENLDQAFAGIPERSWVLAALEDPVDLFAFCLMAAHHGLVPIPASPRWGPDTWERLATLVRPARVFGTPPAPEWRGDPVAPDGTDIIFRTGGSTRHPKFVRHAWSGLHRAAGNFLTFFGADTLHVHGHLPAHHVGGFLPFLRAFASSGTVNPARPADRNGGTSCASVVATTLHRALADPDERQRLAGYDLVLAGGGPFSRDLLARARHAGIRLAPSYGMTETAAMVAACRPDDLADGDDPWLTPMPGTCLRLAPHDGPGPAEIEIATDQAFAGYLGEADRPSGFFATGDCGWLSGGRLNVRGRMGDFVQTGGETVFLPDVAEAIARHLPVADVRVTAEPDLEWGEAIQATIVPDPSLGAFPADPREALRPHLENTALPRRFRLVDRIDRDALGKSGGAG